MTCINIEDKTSGAPDGMRSEVLLEDQEIRSEDEPRIKADDAWTIGLVDFDKPVDTAAMYGQQRGYSLADLEHKTFPEQRWLARDMILLKTTTMLAGRPKKGKSWAAFDLCIAVATGGKWMNQFQCEKGDVYYCALEDTPRRMKDRALKLLEGQPFPRGLMINHFIERNGAQEDYLEAQIKENPNLKLIVIDTLQMFRSPKVKKGGDYAFDYDAITNIHRLSKKYNVAILIIHHTRKSQGAEAVDEISGTSGIAGGVDTWLILGDREGQTRLQGAGRDIEPVNFPVEFCKDKCKWSVLDEVEVKSTKQDTARELLRTFLSEGPKLSAEIKQSVQSCGISLKTLEIVQKECFIEKFQVKDPTTGKNQWWWKLR